MNKVFKIPIRGVEVFLPHPAGSVFIEKCMECFEAETFSEGKYAFLEAPFLEAYDGISRAKALMCSSLSWLQHQLAQPQGEQATMGPTKVLFLCGNVKELNYRTSDFDSLDCFSHIPKILLDLPEKMSAFLRDSWGGESKKHSCVPQIAFATHDLFFQSSLTINDGEKLLRDTIVILDDAHTLEENCRNFASRALNACETDVVIEDLENDSNLLNLCNQIKKFKTLFKTSDLSPRYGDATTPFSYPDKDIRELFKSHYEYLVKEVESGNFEKENTLFLFLNHIFQFPEEDAFRLFLREGQHNDCSDGKTCRSIEIVCVDPSIVFKRLMKLEPHTLIFSSTTLYPLEPLMSELGIPEAKSLGFPPAIEDFKVFARIVTCGAGGYYLNSSNHIREDKDYLTSVGKTILEFTKITPHGKGLIVYFPGNDLMMNCISRWQRVALKGPTETLWKNICKYKDTFAVGSSSLLDEARDEVDNQDVIKFCELAGRLKANRESKGKGCCTMAVLRGQVSEDSSIPSDDRRVVVIIGVPFIPPTDPKMSLKKEFNNLRLQNKMTDLSGAQFMTREAYKVVRQIVDRQIDAVMDHHGVILLCDMRYDKKCLSSWINEKIQVEKRFKELLMEMKDFYNCVDQRVQWYRGKVDPTQCTGTQFGQVPRWELEKVKLEFSKFKKQNDRLDGNIKCLDETLNKLREEKDELLRQLVDLSSVSLETQGEQQIPLGEASGSGENNLQEEVRMEVSTSPIVSPRKRPYPE